MSLESYLKKKAEQAKKKNTPKKRKRQTIQINPNTGLNDIRHKFKKTQDILNSSNDVSITCRLKKRLLGQYKPQDILDKIHKYCEKYLENYKIINSFSKENKYGFNCKVDINFSKVKYKQKEDKRKNKSAAEKAKELLKQKKEKYNG